MQEEIGQYNNTAEPDAEESKDVIITSADNALLVLYLVKYISKEHVLDVPEAKSYGGPDGTGVLAFSTPTGYIVASGGSIGEGEIKIWAKTFPYIRENYQAASVYLITDTFSSISEYFGQIQDRFDAFGLHPATTAVSDWAEYTPTFSEIVLALDDET
ncbi:hypothetical protein CPB83DRAFT_840936 [Crepidotus variabilis]|uniref:Uncharacterized protein n=1 Tax=Crepidotus variabilis TaxID=179855 RepID=A0A9P6E3I2_9AGAR|nr:hypothetical protein CPB83DRAFT_840936 [Crepidotus variabilis]